MKWVLYVVHRPNSVQIDIVRSQILDIGNCIANFLWSFSDKRYVTNGNVFSALSWKIILVLVVYNFQTERFWFIAEMYTIYIKDRI